MSKRVLFDPGADWAALYIDGVCVAQDHHADLLERVLLDYTDISVEWTDDLLDEFGMRAKPRIGE